jgi:hypothetical protein
MNVYSGLKKAPELQEKRFLILTLCFFKMHFNIIL